MDSITRRKISQSMKGRNKSAPHKKRIKQSMLGKKLSKQHKDNISKGMKLYYNSQK